MPHRMTAKIDIRLVPDMTPEDTIAKVQVTPRQARLRRPRNHGQRRRELHVEYRARAPLHRRRSSRSTGGLGVDPLLFPRSGGSWPGSVFTDPPLELAAGYFGLGYGDGAHAPNEFLVVELGPTPRSAAMQELGPLVRRLPRTRSPDPAGASMVRLSDALRRESQVACQSASCRQVLDGRVLAAALACAVNDREPQALLVVDAARRPRGNRHEACRYPELDPRRDCRTDRGGAT